MNTHNIETLAGGTPSDLGVIPCLLARERIVVADADAGQERRVPR